MAIIAFLLISIQRKTFAKTEFVSTPTSQKNTPTEGQGSSCWLNQLHLDELRRSEREAEEDFSDLSGQCCQVAVATAK